MDIFDTPTGNEEIDNYYRQLEKEKTSLHNSIIKPENIKPDTKIDKLNSSFKRYKKHPMVTLDNVEKSDYMNAIVQGLANIKSIIIYYLQKIDVFKEKVEDIPLSYSFSRIIFHLWPYPQDSLDKSFSLSSFYKTVTYLNPIYKSLNNPVDFIVFLLDALHNEDKIINENNKKEQMNEEINKKLKHFLKFLMDNENSIILKTFCWINQKVKHCNECNTHSVMYQKFFTFDLNLEDVLNEVEYANKNQITIHDCINFHKKQKRLFNTYCSSCHKKTNIIDLDSTIIIYPEVFVFLIRMDDNNIVKMKENNKEIVIDENIVFIDINNQKKRYNLLGLIVHDFENDEKKIKNSKYKAYYYSPVDKHLFAYTNNTISKKDKKVLLNLKKYNMYPTVLWYEKCKD